MSKRRKDTMAAPHSIKVSWDGDHGLYVLKCRDPHRDEERTLFLAWETVDLLFEGELERPEGYTLAELNTLVQAEKRQLDDEEDTGLCDARKLEKAALFLRGAEERQRTVVDAMLDDVVGSKKTYLMPVLREYLKAQGYPEGTADELLVVVSAAWFEPTSPTLYRG
jgi:hypothetical protein